MPDYFFHVPASSTGKYHPSYSLGEGGLLRHTLAVVKFLNYFLGLESFGALFTSRERDLLRIAAIMHDSRKSGSQEDYEHSKWTRFEHPLLAAKVVKKTEGLNPPEKDYIAEAIESHMGQWNTDKRSSVKLPKPTNAPSMLVHLADYLASRKDITVLFGGVTPMLESYDIKTYKLNFGKHNGKTLPEVKEVDPGWIEWAKKNLDREPVASLLKEL